MRLGVHTRGCHERHITYLLVGDDEMLYSNIQS